MKYILPAIALLVALWVGYDQVINNRAAEIKETDRRSREIEKEQQKKIDDIEEKNRLKIEEIERKFAEGSIKEVVSETKNEFEEELRTQEQILQQLKSTNLDLVSEVRSKTDSIRQLITEKEQLIAQLQEKDSIIAQQNNIIQQKDSLIAFLKQEIQTFRTKSKEIIDILKEATILEIEGDNLSSFWNKKNKQSKYYSAWLLYKRLYKEYELLSAEDSFHSTWKKLQDLGVELEP